MEQNGRVGAVIKIHIANLDSENSHIRVLAAEALGKMGAVQAAKALIDILNDADTGVRTASVQALGRLSAHVTDQSILASTTEYLISALQDKDEKVRLAALKALGRIASTDAMDALLGQLQDTSRDQHRLIAKIFGAVCSQAGNDDLARHILGQLIPLTHNNDISIRGHALEALGAIIPSLAQKDQFPQVMAVFGKALKGTNSKIREAAVNALLPIKINFLSGSQQDTLAKLLIRNLHLRNHNARANAARTLGKIGEQLVDPKRQKNIIKALIQTLDRKELNIIETIGEWSEDREYIQRRHEVNRDIKQERLTKSLEEFSKIRTSNILQTFLFLLIRAITHMVFWVSLFIEDLDDFKIIHINSDAKEALRKIGEPAVPLLINSLYSLDSEIRTAAIDILQEMNDPRANSPIIHNLKSLHPQVRTSAAQALGKLHVQEAVKPLIKALRDRNARVRWAAATALKAIRVVDDIEPLCLAIQDEKATVREAAVQALGEIGNPGAGQAITHALSDSDTSVRNAAVVALKHISGAGTINILKLALSDVGVRKTAAGILKDLGWIPDKSLEGAYYWLAEENYAQCASCGTFALPALLQKLSELDNNDNVQAKANIIAALGDIGDSQVVPELINLLAGCTDKVIPYDYKLASDSSSKIRPGYTYSHHAKTLIRALAIALGKIGDERATSHLCNALRKAVNDVSPTNSYSSDTDEIPAVLGALGAIADWRAVGPILGILTHKFGKWRSDAVLALDQIGWKPETKENGAAYWAAKHDWDKCLPSGSAAVRYLTIILEDGSEALENRRDAAGALGRIGDKNAIPCLIKTLEQDNLRKYAAQALETMGESSIEFLVKALAHHDANIRIAVLGSLAEIASCAEDKDVRRTVSAVLEKLLDSDDDDLVRKFASKNLGNMAYKESDRGLRDQIIATLIKTLGAVSMISQACIKALAQIGTNAVPPLIAALDNKNERICRASVRALEKIGGKRAHDAIRKYYENLPSAFDLRGEIPRIKTFRVFVSSTFSDFRMEREILQKNVFPSLQKLCEKLGARFQAIDLRWGVSEEASRTQQAMDICLQEIERCQETSPELNFISLIGNRYGAIPLPAEIPGDVFDQIREKVVPLEAELLEWKPAQPVDTKGWYRRDNNARPIVYCLQPRPKELERVGAEEYSAILNRLIPPSDRSAVETWYQADQGGTPEWYVLCKSLPGKDQVERERAIAIIAESSWLIIEEKIRNTLYKATNDPVYITSATHHEIEAGMLDDEKAKDRKNIFCFMKDTGDLPVDGQVGYIDLDGRGMPDKLAQERLQDLRRAIVSKLPAKNVFHYQARWTKKRIIADWSRFENTAYRALSRAIVAEMSRLEGINSLDYEIKEHKNFAENRAKSFRGRSDLLAVLRTYLENGSRHPKALVGISGSGKTTLMSQAAVMLAPLVYHDSDVISRFVGVTPASTNIQSLLTSICYELAGPQEFDEDLIPKDYAGVVATFEFLLKGAPATADRPLIVLIDALDQLKGASDAENYNWLPAELPEHVNLIISSLPGRKNEYRSLLENRITDDDIVPVGPMSMDDCECILKGWLASVGRDLTDSQWQDVHEKVAKSRWPLYLLLVFEEVKHWKSYDELPVYPHGQTGLGDGIQGIIDDLCWRLSQDDMHGHTLLSLCLGYLGAARYGINDREMFKLLSRDATLADLRRRSPKSPAVDELPVVIWAQLYSDLRPYLVHRNIGGEMLLALFHQQFQDAFTRAFLKDNDKVERHKELAIYFNEQPNSFASETLKIPNQRKALELLYHCQQIQANEIAREITLTRLTDLDFIAAKCGIGQADELAEDYEKALTSEAFSAENFKTVAAFARFVGSRKPVLRQHPDRVFLEAFHFLDQSLDIDSLERSQPWLRWINRLAQVPCQEVPAGKILLALTDGKYLLTQYREDIYLWNMLELRLARVLKGHSGQVTAATSGPDGLEFVTADDQNIIKRWDIQTGECLSTMRLEAGLPIKKLLMPCAEHLVTVMGSEKVELWDVVNETRLWANETGSREIIDITWDPATGLVIARCEDGIRVWDLQTGVCQSTLIRKTGSILSLIAQSEHTFYVATKAQVQKGIEIWNLDTRTRLHTFTEAGHTVLFASNTHLLTWDEASKLKYWNVTAGGCEAEFVISKESPRLVTASPDGTRVAALDSSGTITIWKFDPPSCSRETEFKVDYHSAYSCRHIVLSPGGSKLALAFDEEVQIFDTVQGKHLQKMENISPWEENSFSSILFSSDGDLVIIGDKDGQIYAWNYLIGESRNFDGHMGAINTIYVVSSKNWLVSGGSDGKVIIWNILPSLSHHLTIQHTNEIQQLSVSPNGRYLMFSDISGKVCVQDIINDEEPSFAFDEDTGEFAGTLVNREFGPLAISIGQDATLRIWDLAKGTQPRELTGCQAEIIAYTITPDEKHGVCWYKNAPAEIWDQRTWTLARYLQDSNVLVKMVAISPDNQLAVVVHGNGRDMTAWYLSNGKQAWTVASVAAIQRCIILRNGNCYRVVTEESDSTVGVWDAADGAFITKLARQLYQNTLENSWAELSESNFTPVFVMDDEKHAVSSSGNSIANIWDMETGKLNKEFDIAENITAMNKSMGGSSVVLGGEKGAIICYDISYGFRTIDHRDKDGKRILSVAMNSSGSAYWSADHNDLRILPDGRRIYGAGQVLLVANPANESYNNYEAAKSKVPYNFFADKGKKMTLVPDTKFVLWWNASIITIWNYDPFDMLYDYVRYEGASIKAISAPNSQQFVTGDSAGVIKVWDVSTGMLLHEKNTFTGGINTISCSPDRRLYIITGSDGAVILWDVETRMEIARFYGVQKIRDCACSRDARKIVALDQGGQFYLLALENGQ